MMALVRSRVYEGVRLVEVPEPLAAQGEVLIQVLRAGICRTDLYVARGELGTQDPIILGHEFCGQVLTDAAGFAKGELVTASPYLGCGRCSVCCGTTTGEWACSQRRQLGVHRDGVFAERVALPARVVYRLPGGLCKRLGAYVEPLAAALAVLGAGLDPSQRGVVYGQNRIATLTERVLRLHGFSEVTVVPHRPGSVESNSCDFVIEAGAAPANLAEVVRICRPHGTVVLKSRPPHAVGLDIHQAVLKDLTLRACGYGSFEDAIALLAGGLLQVSDLLGAEYPLEAYEEAFARAAAGEGDKCLFAVAEASETGSLGLTG